MKRILSLLATLIICAAMLAGCSGEASFSLADLANPFIGEWQSEIPSANTTLKFNYKTDGTFEYEMAGVPAEQGGKGSGGYMVHNGIMVTWLDFEGAAAYTFEVKDNNTINVTELEPNETGALVPGNTAPFTRVEGSSVIKDGTLKVSNISIGKWDCTIWGDGWEIPYKMEFKTDGTFIFDGEGEIGSGISVVYGNYIVMYTFGHNELGTFSFEENDSETLIVTQFTANKNGERVAGDTARFVRVK